MSGKLLSSDLPRGISTCDIGVELLIALILIVNIIGSFQTILIVIDMQISYV